uniref:CAZy families GH13 protein n=1 Tax=uncultured Corynebacterium sp. TaxID=159447 RepID=A0A060BQ67_9CORY|nr:CAZy families GH13 protein [uncultured Corynebacterium sp.]
MLMTVPGMPSVYYGDEQAFRGRKLEGFRADDELRPPLPRTPKDLFSGGEAMHRFYQRLIALRRQHPWLTRASLEVVGKENEWIEYAVHGTRGEHLDVRIEVAPVERLHIVGAGTDFRWS